MVKQSSTKGILIMQRAFDSSELMKKVEPHKIVRRSNQIVTFYEDKIISKSEKSDKYGILDFSQLISDNIPLIEKVVKPVKYDLTLQRGIQQLKLYSEKMMEDGEVYQRMFTIFSSSNGLYPMHFNAGLFRQVCSNGLMLGTAESFSSSSKHFTKSIDQKIRMLQASLPTFEEEIEDQLLVLRRLKIESVSLRKIYKGLLQSKTSEPRKTAVKRVEKLSEMLQNSSSYAIDFQLSFEQKRGLKRPLELIEESKFTADTQVPKIQILNCYTESYNNRIHAINWRENQRIKDLLLEGVEL